MIEPVLVFGIPVDFILFALTLLGVALFHHHTLPVALAGQCLLLAVYSELASERAQKLQSLQRSARSTERRLTELQKDDVLRTRR